MEEFGFNVPVGVFREGSGSHLVQTIQNVGVAATSSSGIRRAIRYRFSQRNPLLPFLNAAS